MSLPQFQSLIQELGASLGAPDLQADSDGYVALGFDDLEVHLQYETDDELIVMFTRLPAVEVDRAGEIYGMLLHANLFGQGTQGATFSIDADTGRVFLADRHAREGLDGDAIVQWLEHFVNLGVYWRQRLEDANRGGSVQAEDDDAAQPEPPSFPMNSGMRV